MNWKPAMAAEARKALEEGSARAKAAAQSLEQASKQLRQQSVLRAAGVTAACSFGILAAVMAAAWFYFPSKSEMETLRAERAQLQASIEDLASAELESSSTTAVGGSALRSITTRVKATLIGATRGMGPTASRW